MRRKKKTSWAWNFLLVLICGALAVALAGFIVWDSKTEAAKSEKLVQEVKNEKENVKKEDTEEKKDKKEETPEEVKEEKPEEPQMPLQQRMNCSIPQE